MDNSQLVGDPSGNVEDCDERYVRDGLSSSRFGSFLGESTNVEDLGTIVARLMSGCAHLFWTCEWPPPIKQERAAFEDKFVKMLIRYDIRASFCRRFTELAFVYQWEALWTVFEFAAYFQGCKFFLFPSNILLDLKVNWNLRVKMPVM